MDLLIINLLTNILVFTKSVHTNPTSKNNRRVLNGALLSSYEKPFVVYITRNLENDDGWMCGGAIVKPKFIVTAAACVDQNTPLYVIAGMKKYVRPMDWAASGQCIPNNKRKIVRVCRPKDYNFKPEEFFNWFHSDIGVAEIDKPYDFNDLSLRMHCDYVPQPIRLNYESRYQAVNRIGFIYGWGHRYGHTRPEDSINYNRDIMRYANTKVISKRQCSKYLPKRYHSQITLNSTLCTGSGHEYDQDFVPLYMDDKHMRKKTMECGKGRRFINDTDCFNETSSEEDFADEDYNMTDLGGRRVIAAGGLCQDDHGAPLTTYVGSEEILIGIGIAPVLDSQYRCREPNLFTSTFCMSLFLRCVFNEPPLLMTRRLCHEYTKKEGYYIEEIDKSINSVNTEKT